MSNEKVTVRTLRTLKKRGQKAVWMTAYDYPTAVLLDRAGIDGIRISPNVFTTFEEVDRLGKILAEVAAKGI